MAPAQWSPTTRRILGPCRIPRRKAVDQHRRRPFCPNHSRQLLPLPWREAMRMIICSVYWNETFSSKTVAGTVGAVMVVV
jgi:hypothetical protein